MKLFIALVCLVCVAQAININQLSSSSQRQRAWQRELMKEIDCAKTKQGLEQEILLKEGTKDIRCSSAAVEATCNYGYGVVFGEISYDGVVAMEVKADDKCKLELASIAAVNHATKHGAVKQVHLEASTWAAVNLLKCTGFVTACLEGLSSLTYKSKALSFAWKPATGTNYASEFTAKAKENLGKWKISKKLGVQYNVGVPIGAFSVAYNADTANQAKLWPYATRQGSNQQGGCVFNAGTDSWGQKCTGAGLAKDVEDFCLMYAASRFQFDEVRKTIDRSKDTRSILPKMDTTSGLGAQYVTAATKKIADFADVWKGADGTDVAWSGNELKGFTCGTVNGVVVEVRNGPQAFLKPFQSLFGSKLATATETDAGKAAQACFKLQEDIWAAVKKLNEPPPTPEPTPTATPKKGVVQQQAPEGPEF